MGSHRRTSSSAAAAAAFVSLEAQICPVGDVIVTIDTRRVKHTHEMIARERGTETELELRRHCPRRYGFDHSPLLLLTGVLTIQTQ